MWQVLGPDLNRSESVGALPIPPVRQRKRYAVRALLVPHSAGGVEVSFVSRIVLHVLVFETQRTNGRYLSDVLAGLCPVEVPRIAGQNDDAAGWIRLDLIAVESKPM
jgi:hypothetical protein